MNASPLAVWRSWGMTPNRSHSESSVNWRIGGPVGERAVLLQMQSQVHGVEAAVQEPHAEVPLVAGIERRDVVADMVAHDHAIAEVPEETFERLPLVDPAAALVPRHAMHGDGAGVVDLNQRRELILEHDFAGLHGHRTDGDDRIDLRVEPRRLRVEDDEADLVDRGVIGPGGVERLPVGG